MKSAVCTTFVAGKSTIPVRFAAGAGPFFWHEKPGGRQITEDTSQRSLRRYSESVQPLHVRKTDCGRKS